MKSPTHIAVSIGYGAAVAGLAGADGGYGAVLLGAFAGGVVIDLVDHPLFHLVTHRGDPNVAAVRKEFRTRGAKAAWRLASQHEEARAYSPLFFHRLPWLLAVAIVGALLALGTHASAPLMAFTGALLLHMICDVVGDVAAVGHAENWLRGSGGAWIRDVVHRWGWPSAVLIGSFVLTCFAAITIRLGVAAAGNGDQLLIEALVQTTSWLIYLPLAVLTVYLVTLTVLVYLSGRLYVLSFRPEPLSQRLPFSVGSLFELRRLVGGGRHPSRPDLERLLLAIQADQAPWTLIVAGGIGVSISIASVFHLESEVLVFLVPVITAIVFNTLVHSTIGQLGGSLGAIASWWLNLGLGQIGLVAVWAPEFALVVAAAAAGSWLFGLLSGMLLRGRVRMSAACFVAHIPIDESTASEPIDLARLLRVAISDGHSRARRQLAESGLSSLGPPRETQSDGVVTGVADRRDSWSASTCCVSGCDRYNPFLREASFVIEGAVRSPRHESVMPVLPRQRLRGVNRANSEFTSSTLGYSSNTGDGKVPSLAVGPMRERRPEGLTKSWSEIVDHFNTRYTDLRTDAFVRVDADRETATVWGSTREVTSTKEYGTIEAEVYASSVLQALGDQVRIGEQSVTRVFFPRASIFDIDAIRSGENAAYTSQLDPSDRGLVALSLDALNRTASRRITTAVTADSGRTVVALLIQLALGTVLGTYGIQTL